MDRPTDLADDSLQAIASFYDGLAPDYDAMTGFEKRFVQERPFFRLLVENHRIHTALDAGCGTGFHALLLARLGVSVTAIDVSSKMLDRLRIHAREMSLSLSVMQTSFDRVREALHAPVDAVFSLGNTIAHMRSRQELSASLGSFFEVLRAGGVLFLQGLNYDRLLAIRERIQSVRETDAATYIRTYDYHDESVQFNVLKLERDAAEPVLHSLPLRPVKYQELLDLLEQTGFADVRSFGGISLEPYIAPSSKDLVILARKPL